MSLLNSIGQSGLAAAYAQLQTTGNNIANVNTPGYVRQEVILSPSAAQFTSVGNLGRGVDVVQVSRNYDQFLTRELNQSTSLAGGDAARASSLERLDQMLADTDNGLGVAMDDLRLALADVVNRPDDVSARSVVISRAGAMAAQFRDVSAQMHDLAVTTDQKIGQSVDLVNSQISAIAALNQRIVSSTGASGQAPHDLVDQRELLIRQVSEQLQVTTQPANDGSVGVFSASGHALVLGGNASKLVTQTNPIDPSKVQVAIQTNGAKIALDAASLGSGEIAGLLRFRDQDLASAQARVGQLAAAVAGAYNAQQALGIDADGNVGGELFGVAAPVTVAAASNTGNVELKVTVTDPTQLAATDYRLSFDGAAYRIENLVDGTVRTLPGIPATIDGLMIEAEFGSMSIGDRVTIKGASVFATDMRATLSDGDGLATGYAAGVATGPGNTGNVAMAAFAQTAGHPDAAAAVTITFTSPTTFNVSGAGTGNPVGLNYVAGEPISFNGWDLTLQGTPATGDTVSLTPTADAGVDNRNARALVALGDKQLVNGQTFNQSFAALLADVGNRTVQGQSAARTSNTLLSNATAAVDSKSGVNLDEEAARLIQFQQAYQAAAQVIATSNAMFDTILSVIAR